MTGSAVLTRGESAHGSWVNATRPADPRLRPLFARDPLGFAESTTAFGVWLMPPTPTVTVIANLAGPFGGLPAAFVAGVDDTYSLVRHGGTTRCLDLKLTPLGAYRLLGVPMSEIAGQVVDLADVLGAEGGRLAAMLADEAAGAGPYGEDFWTGRLDLLDRFLMRRAAAGPSPSKEIAWAWRRLVSSGGRVPIGDLADGIGWSRRHLIARFRRETGLAPKTMARIIRFSRLLDLIAAADGPIRWDRLAAECGYYDQAHLNRDFREFAGTTPSDYLTRRVPGGSVIGDGVKSFQDTASPAA